jgi:DNA-binding CsgD family transcriptional regulator
MADILRQRPPRRDRRSGRGETARERRKRLRQDAAVERERQVLELFIKGYTFVEIGDRLEIHYSTAWNNVQRGLKRRAEQDGEIAAKARAMLQMQIEALMGTWMPRALGIDRETGERTVPDPRAADIMDRYIRRYAEITGAMAPVKLEGDIAFYPPDPQAAITTVLEGLARLSAKNEAIDGHLAEAGHTHHELTGGERDDALPPPFQEGEAA